MNPKDYCKPSYGVYMMGSRNGDRLNAQIANTVLRVTSDFPTVAVSINKRKPDGEMGGRRRSRL